MANPSRARLVTVFGGSGFVGRHIVRRLAAQGTRVRVAVRDPEGALFLKPAGEVGQINAIACNVADRPGVVAAVDGADAVIFLPGILAQWGSQTFQRVVAEGARNVAESSRDAGVKSLVLMSAIADPETGSEYARTKAEAEAATFAAFPQATVLKPSVIFGPEDDFFNQFADMARFAPALPVFGCPFPPKVSLDALRTGGQVIDLYGSGGTRFQPVYVGDVAEAAVRALESGAARGNSYELGGPRVYSYKQLMELVLTQTGRDRYLIPVPFGPMRLAAVLFEQLPKPLVTRDQLKLLSVDNVVSEGARTLVDLGIEPTAAEAILPTYLKRFRPPLKQKLRAV